MKKLVSGAAGLIVLCAFAAGAQSAGAETFRYQYREGEKYRIVSTVQEDVYVDRVLSHRAEILNRIAVEVLDASGSGARHRATFQTSERSTGVRGASFQWAREYESVFARDAAGRYTIGKEYWMPVVRDVPVFPDQDMAVGDSWSADAEEVHDFRDSFGIQEPYRIPIQVRYRHLGERKPQKPSFGDLRNSAFPAFTVSYRIFDEPPRPQSGGRLWPVRIMGASDQVVYWDREYGRPAAYEESFRMVFELSNGATVEYRGAADALIVESTPMNRTEMAAEIAKDIQRMDIQDTAVRVTEEGVSISLEDIQFQPDSAVLLPDERQKLERIAAILGNTRSGHPGGRPHRIGGTEQGRQILSRERAAAVAEYLIGLGARNAERVVVRGFGASKPVANNSTEEGRRKNRRVDITLLEN
jgi:outer membrane protein OmpA-like peptidoglycan-associated protein